MESSDPVIQGEPSELISILFDLAMILNKQGVT